MRSRHRSIPLFLPLLCQSPDCRNATAPCVFKDAQRTLYDFESTHRAFRKSVPIFGPMRYDAGAAVGTASCLGKGLNVVAIRNAPMPMPHAPT